jgi:hypothetical protein
MRTVLERVAPDDLSRGGWLPQEWDCGTEDDGRWTAYIRCPKCHHLAGLRNHTIDAAGNVEASVLHSYVHKGVEKCGWHEFVTLAGWPPALKKDAGTWFLTFASQPLGELCREAVGANFTLGTNQTPI